MKMLYHAYNNNTVLNCVNTRFHGKAKNKQNPKTTYLRITDSGYQVHAPITL